MSATMVMAVGALIGAPLAALAAVYGSRVAGRVQREGGVIKGYNTLTDQLQEERNSLREQLTAAEAETVRLRLLVIQLGGTP